MGDSKGKGYHVTPGGVLTTLLVLLAVGVGVYRWSPRAPAARVVATARAVPAHVRLTAADLELVEVHRAFRGGVDSAAMDSLIGRLTTAALDSGAVVRRNGLVDLPGEWWVFSFDADSGMLLRPGEPLALLGRGTTGAWNRMNIAARSLGAFDGKVLVAVPESSALSVAQATAKEPGFIVARRIPAAPPRNPRPVAPPAVPPPAPPAADSVKVDSAKRSARP